MKHLFAFLLLASLLSPLHAAELKTLPGNVASALELPGLTGGKVNLTDLRGKVVLVNFWATWCPPCRKEMPSMNRLAEKLAGKPFAILGVDAGESAEEVRAFLRQVPVNFPILLDEEGSSLKPWQVFVFPTSYIIDKQGRLRFGLVGSIEWDAPDTLARIEALMRQ
jgi:thiol-disulfide isomerase/thioredoxin